MVRKKTKYIRIITGQGKHIFVREEDMKELRKSMKAKPFNSKKIMANTLKVLLNSPEGLNELAEATFWVHRIFKIDDIKQLENIKDLVQSQIDAVKHKEKIKESEKRKKHDTYNCAICGKKLELAKGGNPDNLKVIFCNKHTPEEMLEFDDEKGD